MLKHITTRDIVEFFLFGIGIALLVLLAAVLESTSISVGFWIAAVVSVFLWIIWARLTVNERNMRAKAPQMYMMINGKWEPIAPATIGSRRSKVRIFDQDADAIQHLDYDETKENKA